MLDRPLCPPLHTPTTITPTPCHIHTLLGVTQAAHILASPLTQKPPHPSHLGVFQCPALITPPLTHNGLPLPRAASWQTRTYLAGMMSERIAVLSSKVQAARVVGREEAGSVLPAEERQPQ